MNISHFHQLIKKSRSVWAFGLILASVLLMTACGENARTTTDNSPDSPAPSSTVVLSPTEPENGPLDVAKEWAEAVKARDGKAQYALMTKALQAKVYDEFSGLNWVTGTSSPWVESFSLEKHGEGVRVTFEFATSTGPSGSYYQDLAFETEDGATKIASLSELTEVADSSASAPAFPQFKALIGLLGLTKDELLAAVPEEPVGVDEGGLGFDKSGIRVWFDDETHTKVAQVLIMSDQIDINGVKVGGKFDDFKAKFGEPISDQNGDAHFKYGEVYLSVVRDIDTGTVIAVYILAEDF